MPFFNNPHACIILLIAYFGAGSFASHYNPDVRTHRMLRAATKRSDLYRRSMRIGKTFETEVVYVDNENVWNDESTFASQVKVASQKPVFNLEEHEHHLQDVQCGDGMMKLYFVDASSTRDARAAFHGPDGGLIITSHESCNEEGERSVYRTHDASFTNEGRALELSVTRTSWQDAFDHIQILFGNIADEHLYRRHADFAKIYQKRQDKVDIPVDTPDTVTAAMFNLTSELLNTTFSAGSFLGGISDLVRLPKVPIEIGCTSCTTQGQLALTQGAIRLDPSQIDFIPDIFEGGDDGKGITNVITGGFMELTATGVGARLEMFARPATSGGFEIALFKLPILGFVIPGIGKAGAIFESRVAVEFTVSGGVEVHYGLDVQIPDGSSIRVELTDLANSSVKGFPGSTLTPLPININVTDAEISLGLAFKPSIPIGFEFTDRLKAEVTVSMSIPSLDAKLSSNITDHCGNNSNATLPQAPYANKTLDLPNKRISLGPLVPVEANISVTVDVALDLALPLFPPRFQAIGTSTNIFSTVLPLVTSCVSPEDVFSPTTGVVAPPAATSSTISATMLLNTTAMLCNSTSTIVVTNTSYVTSTAMAKTAVTLSGSMSSMANMTITAYVTSAYASTGHVISPVSDMTSQSMELLPSSMASVPQFTLSVAPSSLTSVASAVSSGSSESPSMQDNVTTASLVSLSTISTTSTALASPIVTEFPAPPTSAATISVGFLVSSNFSIVPVQQTGVAQFTGAATLGAEVPIGEGSLVWRIGIMVLCVLF